MAVFAKISNYKNIGLLIGRAGLGAMMMYHGVPKIMGGIDMWEKLGGAMKLVGINFLPVFWGFAAAATESFGGFFIVLGLFFRPAALLLIFTMMIAALSHLSAGDGLMTASHAIETGFAFIVLLFTGPGKYSVDKK